MEPNNNIDGYLRKRLDGHEIKPPAFSQGLLKTIPQKKPFIKPFWWFLGSGSIAAGIVIVFFLVWNNSDSHLSVPSNEINIQSTTKTNIQPPDSFIPEIQNYKSETESKPYKHNTSEALNEADVSEHLQLNVRSTHPVSFLITLPAQFASEKTKLLSRNFYTEVAQLKSEDELRNPVKKWNRAERELSAGLSFTPEWLFNTAGLDSKNARTAGLEINYRVHNYSVRSGISMSRTNSLQQWSFTYKPYLGSYQKLDSISFVFDNELRIIVPKYFLSDINLYDEQTRDDLSFTNAPFTYLQIPIILGYDFNTSKRLRFGIRTGPTLSILMTESNDNPDYNAGNNKLVSSTNISPERLKTNWQYTAGPVCNITIAHGFEFELEPHLKYYFNSVYEKPTPDRPFAVGIRASFLLSL